MLMSSSATLPRFTLGLLLSLLIPASIQSQWEIVNKGGYIGQIEFLNDQVGCESFPKNIIN